MCVRKALSYKIVQQNCGVQGMQRVSEQYTHAKNPKAPIHTDENLVSKMPPPTINTQGNGQKSSQPLKNPRQNVPSYKEQSFLLLKLSYTPPSPKVTTVHGSLFWHGQWPINELSFKRFRTRKFKVESMINFVCHHFFFF